LKNDSKEEISGALKQGNANFTIVSDLCGLCATKNEDIKNLMSSSEEILVIACRPRTVKLLLNSAGFDSKSPKMHFYNFLDHDLNHLLEEIKNFGIQGNNLHFTEEIKSNPEWPAWYPLIDYSRCSSCGQCADFCLFGVYEKKNNMVVVVNPEGCKTNCPACARICPKTAIVFPKYELGGAIAGDESIDETEELKRQQKDIDVILGSEIYQALEKRKLKRQSIIRNQAMQEAIKERVQALNEYRKK